MRACSNPIGGNAYIGAAAFALLLLGVALPPAAEGDVFAFVFGTALAAVVWLFLRAARMGVYVNRRGVLLRRFWRPNVEFAWRSVEGFDVVRRRRNGAEVDQVRMVADGATLWLPLVVRDVRGYGPLDDVDWVANSLAAIHGEFTADRC